MKSPNSVPAGPEGPACHLPFPLPESASDVAGWERFVQRYGTFLARCVRRAFRAADELCLEEDVEDIVQNLYTRLLADEGHRLKNFRGTTEEELFGYLRRTATRLSIDVQRRARAVKRGGGVSMKVVRDLEAQGKTSLEGRPSPEERLLAQESCRLAIREALPSRPSWARRDLKILRLSLIEGRTSREISQAWGGTLHPSSVDSSMHRMRQRLAASSLNLGELGMPA
jgi:RNA polymerase sigma factor (sigma-70 family)